MSNRVIIPPPNNQRDFYKLSPKVLFVVTVLIWAAISLFNTGIFVFSYEDEGPVYEFFHGLRWTPLYHSPWLLITPFIIFAARIFPINQAIKFKNLTVHITLALVIAYITSVLHTGFIHIRLGEGFQFRSSPPNFLFYSVDRVMIYFAVLLGYYGVDYYKKQNRESLKELKLRESISRQNLNSFKKEIHSEFLLNTIGDIHNTLHMKPERAETIIADFAQVVRSMLLHSQKPIIHTDEDIRFLKAYVSLLEIRIEKQIIIYNSVDKPVRNFYPAISNHIIRFIETLYTLKKRSLKNLESIQYETFETDLVYGKRVVMVGIGESEFNCHSFFSDHNEAGIRNNDNSLYSNGFKTENVNSTEEGDLVFSITSPKQKS